MTREDSAELLDGSDVPDDLVKRGYEDLARIHRFLGDTATVVDRIRRGPQPVRRVLEVGCATGLVLREIERELRVEVIGVDINPHPSLAAPVAIRRANAVTDALPVADVAYCMHLAHHLGEAEILDLIANVGNHCRRFIILDLVRHAVPLWLFRMFVAPFVSAINVHDGQRSIQRAYTPDEWRMLTSLALRGTGSTCTVTVAPLFIRQVIDISYPPDHRRVCAGRDISSTSNMCGLEETAR